MRNLESSGEIGITGTPVKRVRIGIVPVIQTPARTDFLNQSGHMPRPIVRAVKKQHFQGGKIEIPLVRSYRIVLHKSWISVSNGGHITGKIVGVLFGEPEGDLILR